MADIANLVSVKIGEPDLPNFLVPAIRQFTCGNNDLDDFLKEKAALYYSASLASTFLYVDKELEAVAGYVSICNGSISRKIFHDTKNNVNPVSNRRFQNKVLSDIAESKYMQEYPATKIARLAIDKRFQHFGLGTMLVAGVLQIARESSSASRFITVDAKIETLAYEFYKKLGFDYVLLEDEQGVFRQDKETAPMYLDLLR